MKYKNLERAFEEEAKALVDESDKGLSHNWINTETKACKNCYGHGIDPEDKTFCIACDASGVDMKIEYGVQDGKFVSRVTQYGVDAVKELAKLSREVEADKTMKQRVGAPLTKAYYLTTAARMELMMLYPEFEQLETAGEHRKIASYVRKHFPDLLATHLTI